MKRDLNHEELRDEKIIELTSKHLAARRALLRDGDRKTVIDVSDAVLDLLSLESIHELVIESQHAARAAIGKKFVDVVTAVLVDDAECAAIREVEQLEQAAKNDPDNCRTKKRAHADFLDLRL